MVKIFTLFITFLMMSESFGQGNHKTELYKGNQSFENQNFEEASLYYLKSIEYYQKEVKAHYNLGNAFYKQNKYAEAVAQYQNALKHTENNAEKMAILYNLGNAYFKQNNLKKAIDSYQQALKLSPNHQDILQNLRIAKKQHSREQKRESNSEGTQKNEDKELSEEEKNLLKYLALKEMNTARKTMSNKGDSQPKRKLKDW